MLSHSFVHLYQGPLKVVELTPPFQRDTNLPPAQKEGQSTLKYRVWKMGVSLKFEIYALRAIEMTCWLIRSDSELLTKKTIEILCLEVIGFKSDYSWSSVMWLFIIVVFKGAFTQQSSHFGGVVFDVTVEVFWGVFWEFRPSAGCLKKNLHEPMMTHRLKWLALIDFQVSEWVCSPLTWLSRPSSRNRSLGWKSPALSALTSSFKSWPMLSEWTQKRYTSTLDTYHP